MNSGNYVRTCSATQTQLPWLQDCTKGQSRGREHGDSLSGHGGKGRKSWLPALLSRTAASASFPSVSSPSSPHSQPTKHVRLHCLALAFCPSGENHLTLWRGGAGLPGHRERVVEDCRPELPGEGRRLPPVSACTAPGPAGGGGVQEQNTGFKGLLTL